MPVLYFGFGPVAILLIMISMILLHLYGNNKRHHQ